jgi:hypothetical protein
VEVGGVPEVNAGQEVEVDAGQEVEVDAGQGLDRGQEVELEVDAGSEVNSRQRRVGDKYAMGGIRFQTSLPRPDRGRCLPELPAASRASRCLQSFLPSQQPSTSSRPPYLHAV